MPPPFRVGDHLTVELVREFNLAEWSQGPDYYFGPSKAWWRPEAEVLRMIASPTYDVQALIDAVPPYPSTSEGLRQAWSHHMAVHAGCHPWPNANHRTANLVFNYALEKAGAGKQVGFVDPAMGARLVSESHERRDMDGGEYTVAELADPAHPYRRLFAQFSQRLVVADLKDSGRLARFGPRHPDR